MVEDRLEALAAERRGYVSRIRQLVGVADRRMEVMGYLTMIENLNDAIIALAQLKRGQLGPIPFRKT
jgi:hypothetical protein